MRVFPSLFYANFKTKKHERFPFFASYIFWSQKCEKVFCFWPCKTLPSLGSPVSPPLLVACVSVVFAVFSFIPNKRFSCDQLCFHLASLFLGHSHFIECPYHLFCILFDSLSRSLSLIDLITVEKPFLKIFKKANWFLLCFFYCYRYFFSQGRI